MSLPGPHSDLARKRLTDLRHGLLKLHKALLDSERLSYERTYGRIATRGEFFQLVIGNEWFGWLHQVSELVVQIDEMLDAEEPVTPVEATKVIDRTRLMLKPAEEGEGFAKRYFDAMQRDPDVVLAHAAVKKLLRRSAFHLN
ncbi:MAG TPA: hypothetical protein VL285_23830 [Bryobacteraceae bacterium]|jgi:hypothetical protein|nr:hypothetical protein [Bryobacteraceae bacterium]